MTDKILNKSDTLDRRDTSADGKTLTPNPTSHNQFDEDKKVIDRDETRDLISSEKVDGTAVFDRAGEKLGSIHHFMVGKRSGKVRYAVMSFGGLFGMGEDYYPLPWAALTYDTDRRGYVVKLSKDQLDKDKAPHFPQASEPEWNRAYDEKIEGYYISFA
ncbi:MAG: PRC-barrel domain-containing protein [Sphingomicrobium sp.]